MKLGIHAYLRPSPFLVFQQWYQSPVVTSPARGGSGRFSTPPATRLSLASCSSPLHIHLLRIVQYMNSPPASFIPFSRGISENPHTWIYRLFATVWCVLLSSAWSAIVAASRAKASKARTPSMNEESPHHRNILEVTWNCKILVSYMKVGRLHPSSLGPLQALGATMPRLIEAQLSAVHLSYRVMARRKMPSKFIGHNIYKHMFDSLPREGCSRDILHINFRRELGSASLFI